MDIFVRILNPVLMIVLGLGAGVVIARRLRVDWGIYGIGALVFIGSQVLHIPFNQFVLQPALASLGVFGGAEGPNYAWLGLALGLSAGVFEEFARYLVYRFKLKDQYSWNTAMMLGAGHGGIEAVLLGILTLINAAALMSPNQLGLTGDLSAQEMVILQSQIDQFWAAPWYIILLGAAERAIAIGFHLAMSVLVLQSFMRSQIAWTFLAVALHTLFNALAVYVLPRWGPFATEGLLLSLMLVCLWAAFRLRSSQPEPALLQKSPTRLDSLPRVDPSELTKDQIEDSRYA